MILLPTGVIHVVVLTMRCPKNDGYLANFYPEFSQDIRSA